MTKSTISWHTKCILSASISKKHPFSPSEKHSLRAGGQWVVLPVNVAHGDFPIPQNLASLAPSSGSAICDCRSYSTSSGESGNSSSERPGGKKRKTSTESTWSRLWNSHSNSGQIINISGSIQQTAAVVSFLWGKKLP